MLEDLGLRPDAEPGPAVRIVRGRPAVAECWERLQRSASTEVCQFDRPPFVVPEPDQATSAAMATGVVYRTVYDQTCLAPAQPLEVLRSRAARGERIRLLPCLPTKLGLVDRRWALVPVSLDSEADSALLVRTSALLAGLVAMFESWWQRGVPLSSVDERPRRPAAEVDRRLLALLACGMTDKNIARRLGIGLRTTQRHVRALMDALGARSRFEAGVLASQLGLLTSVPQELRVRSCQQNRHGEPL